MKQISFSSKIVHFGKNIDGRPRLGIYLPRIVKPVSKGQKLSFHIFVDDTNVSPEEASQLAPKFVPPSYTDEELDFISQYRQALTNGISFQLNSLKSSGISQFGEKKCLKLIEACK